MGKGYGAIEGAEQGEVDHSFDADNLRFLPDEDENLSKAQRVRKYLLVAVPILVAILVVGGAALFLLRDFSHLYPGPGGSSSSSGRHPVYHGGTTPSAPTAPASPPRTPPTVPSQPTTPTSPKVKSTGDAACSAHPNCKNLVGDCCPTKGGIFLECC